MKVLFLLIVLLLASCASSDDYTPDIGREASGSSFESGKPVRSPAGHANYCTYNPEHLSCQTQNKTDSEPVKPST